MRKKVSKRILEEKIRTMYNEYVSNPSDEGFDNMVDLVGLEVEKMLGRNSVILASTSSSWMDAYCSLSGKIFNLNIFLSKVDYNIYFTSGDVVIEKTTLQSLLE